MNDQVVRGHVLSIRREVLRALLFLFVAGLLAAGCGASPLPPPFLPPQPLELTVTASAPGRAWENGVLKAQTGDTVQLEVTARGGSGQRTICWETLNGPVNRIVNSGFLYNSHWTNWFVRNPTESRQSDRFVGLDPRSRYGWWDRWGFSWKLAGDLFAGIRSTAFGLDYGRTYDFEMGIYPESATTSITVALLEATTNTVIDSHSFDGLTPGSWQRLSTTLDAGTTHQRAYVAIFFARPGSHTAYLDEVRLEDTLGDWDRELQAFCYSREQSPWVTFGRPGYYDVWVHVTDYGAKTTRSAVLTIEVLPLQVAYGDAQHRYRRAWEGGPDGCGCAADGATDDASCINACVTALSTGGVIDFGGADKIYKIGATCSHVSDIGGDYGVLGSAYGIAIGRDDTAFVGQGATLRFDHQYDQTGCPPNPPRTEDYPRMQDHLFMVRKPFAVRRNILFHGLVLAYALDPGAQWSDADRQYVLATGGVQYLPLVTFDRVTIRDFSAVQTNTHPILYKVNRVNWGYSAQGRSAEQSQGQDMHYLNYSRASTEGNSHHHYKQAGYSYTIKNYLLAPNPSSNATCFKSYTVGGNILKHHYVTMNYCQNARIFAFDFRVRTSGAIEHLHLIDNTFIDARVGQGYYMYFMGNVPPEHYSDVRVWHNIFTDNNTSGNTVVNFRCGDSGRCVYATSDEISFVHNPTSNDEIRAVANLMARRNWEPGHTIRVSGSRHNDGDYVIVDQAGASVVSSDVRFNADAAGPDTIVCGACNFQALGFDAPHFIRVTGGANAGYYQIAAVSGGMITLTNDDSLTQEAAGTSYAISETLGVPPVAGRPSRLMLRADQSVTREAAGATITLWQTSNRRFAGISFVYNEYGRGIGDGAASVNDIDDMGIYYWPDNLGPAAYRDWMNQGVTAANNMNTSEYEVHLVPDPGEWEFVPPTNLGSNAVDNDSGMGATPRWPLRQGALAQGVLEDERTFTAVYPYADRAAINAPQIRYADVHHNWSSVRPR
ncbi:MAG: hypothetical protein ACE5JQ_05420 [Candidatus Methylomirabilales bacterium]